MRIVKLFREFLHSDKAVGIILIICTMASLVIANSAVGNAYIDFWHLKMAGMSLEHWINDGLMTIFFLLIGLELEREIYIGELSSKKSAVLPFFSALGGMLIPAGIFLLFNFGGFTQSGTAIPIATDIAFALGILSLLGKRVPVSLKVFLTALAVIDDLGAIVIISAFYSNSISWLYLGLAVGILLVLIVFNRMKITNLIPYLIGGGLMWFLMLNSGIHATITGVILAFVIPFRSIKNQSPSEIMLDILHSPVSFIILPLFALANTAIVMNTNISDLISSPLGVGIIAGLVLGKPVGILLFTYISTQLGIAKLPNNLSWNHVFGAGLLAGIGFTMSIFIALLAFDSTEITNGSKLLILGASLIAGILGFTFLSFSLKGKS